MKTFSILIGAALCFILAATPNANAEILSGTSTSCERISDVIFSESDRCKRALKAYSDSVDLNDYDIRKVARWNNFCTFQGFGARNKFIWGDKRPGRAKTELEKLGCRGLHGKCKNACIVRQVTKFEKDHGCESLRPGEKVTDEHKAESAACMKKAGDGDTEAGKKIFHSYFDACKRIKLNWRFEIHDRPPGRSLGVREIECEY